MHESNGYQWSLSIRMNDQSREIYGSNAYSENFDQAVGALEWVIQKPLK